MAHQFLTERNWWQFNNPKNDAMNIQVEVGELLEHFKTYKSYASINKEEVANEMADVLFATFTFAASTSIDIAASIGAYINNTKLTDNTITYEEIAQIICTNHEAFNLNRLCDPQEVAISLTLAAIQLSDPFIWCSPTEAITIAHHKHDLLIQHVASLTAHLVYLANLIEINLPKAYTKKMAFNASKYPVQDSTEEQYTAIKEQYRKK